MKLTDVFEYKGKDDSQCKLCNDACLRKGGNTTGLWRHLESKHQAYFQKLKVKGKKSTQTKITDHNSYSTISKEHKELSEKNIAIYCRWTPFI